MEPLWAPWRMEFIEREQPQGCIFCLFPAETGEGADPRNLILGRSRHSFALLNKYPYNNGHLMVVPRRHTADFAGLEAEESADLHRLLQLAVSIVGEAYRPEGMNLGMNLGKSAGAGIPGHLHYHLVPRWTGDTNFMPVLSGTKVMIEHLSQSYEKLRPLFDRHLEG
ncbi:MAG: HIT domain-containing protein [Myxococcaceae bacterium]